MRLKLAYQRSSGHAVDVVVTTDAAASVGDIARELLDADPVDSERRRLDAAVTLSVSPPGGGSHVTIAPDRTVGEAPIASGCSVSVVPAPVAGLDAGGQVAAILRVTSGPDAGRSFNLPAGSSVVGRDARADVVLGDSFVSKRHARIDVGATVEVVDLNSANGVVVDGVPVSRLTLPPGQGVLLGDSWLTVTPVGAAVAPPERAMQGGAVPFHRSPRVEARYPEQQHPRPQVPSPPEPPMFAWIMLAAPIVMGVSMFVLTGRAMSLLFVAMAPMMMAGNYLNTKRRTKRQFNGELARFEAQLDGLEGTLAAAIPAEAAVRRAEAPAVAEIYRAGLDRGSLLWTRRPEHWSFLSVRLGTATLPSRNTLSAPPDIDDGMPELSERLRELESRFSLVGDVPLVESGAVAGALGVVGAQHAPDALRGLLLQLTGLHSPAELVVVALTSQAERAELEWLRWLPHTSSPQSPIQGIHLADTQPSIGQVVAELEEMVRTRLGRGAEEPPPPQGPLAQELAATVAGGRLGSGDPAAAPPRPVVVVVVTEQAPVDRARLVQLGDRAAQAGILPIWLAAEATGLPAICRTFLDVSAGLTAARAHFVRHGTVVEGVVAEGVSREHAERFALALAPLFDSGAAVADASDLPQHVPLVSLLGADLAESGAAVVDRWRQNLSLHIRGAAPQPRPRPGSLRALVGQMGVDAMHLDLRGQGPHALVAGTTGAGKSEFLQAWVLGMAAEYSPDRVTFLFVDYKGGAAFAECVRLPHCVGLVTDLSPHLVRRALTSLRAELRHREHLLNRKKAKDLLELEKRGDPEAPPALVLVIDEFAALKKEVPDFVDGVVDIAQRGRSLGIHLIMATQRPAGVISDNIRANTNLRIALRVADESDSSDVIGTPVAASFDPALPGRAIAKSGPGRLTPFQSAYAGGHTDVSATQPASVQVHPLRFGAEEPWQRPEADRRQGPADLGPTDQVRLVESIVEASRLAEVPAPRKPWLEELSPAYDLALLGPRTDAELILGVADLPEEQAQRVVTFLPDVDGNLAVYGTSGSGKSVLLRTLAAAAGITPRGGPVHVYALDFAAGGLRMLEPLPHVGAVVAGEDHERVVRLLRTLRDLAEERARTFPQAGAGTITDYRRLAGRPDEPRLLLLIDNLPAFRDAYEVVGPRAQWYGVLQQLMSEGRQLGIHVVFTADRHASVPGAMAASVPRRVVLRLADDNGYRVLGVPGDVLDGAGPGRAVIDGLETQIAVLGGLGNVADQSHAMAGFARSMVRRGVPFAPRVGALPTEIRLVDLPTEVGGQPLLGISDETLEPIGFDPTGCFVIGGGPGSGRTNAVLVLARSLRRWKQDLVLVYFGVGRSIVPSALDWDVVATTPEEIAEAARQLSGALAGPERKRRLAIFVEGVGDLVNGPADKPLVELVQRAKRSDHLVVGDSESATWGSIYPLYAEFKSARRGLLLQPDWVEGEAIFRTPFPRLQRTEFPVGRGMAVAGGRAVRVQLPLAGGERSPLSASTTAS
ncbi:FtsK/SpoIIIE domain-containing protein [Nocardioides sp.]|uniref:FtsK/SpoIIIE domain-containing protein n=1 Tax=Nocardioides sp. TaxID=35761 RepID=UPI0039E4CB31